MNSLRKNKIKLSKSKITVQVCLLIISISYLYLGLIRIFVGAPDLTQAIDNSMRFYAGGSIAIGLLAIWAMITVRLENIIILFFAFFVFMTGIGRLVSIFHVGLADNVHLFYLAIELLLPFIMLVFQIKSNKE